MLKFKRIEFDLDTGRILDDASSLECLGGGKGGGTVYVPQPTPAPTPPAPPPPAEAATFETASDTANKLEANKKGAKSLQIPLTSNTDADKAVGTV